MSLRNFRQQIPVVVEPLFWWTIRYRLPLNFLESGRLTYDCPPLTSSFRVLQSFRHGVLLLIGFSLGFSKVLPHRKLPHRGQPGLLSAALTFLKNTFVIHRHDFDKLRQRRIPVREHLLGHR